MASQVIIRREPSWQSGTMKAVASRRTANEVPQILSLRGLTFVRFLHCGFCADETDLGMLAIAERLIQATATKAKRESRFAGKIEFIARSIHQFNGSFGSFHSIWAVWTNRDFHLSHHYLRVWRSPCRALTTRYRRQSDQRAK